MSGTGKSRTPLVAERRYPADKPVKAKPAGKKKPARRKAARKTARKPSGNLLVRLVVGLFSLTTRLIWRLTWIGTTVTAALVGLGVAYFYSTMPPASDFFDQRARGSVTLLDRDDQVFAWRGEQFGRQLTSDTVSPYLRNAIISTEDKRFYGHFGVSPRGVASAVRINLSAGRGPLSGNGGSTITQQTAKLICLGTPYIPANWDSETAYEAECRRSTMWRKIKEAVYAVAMEARYSKGDILTIYMSRAFLGEGSRGFEAASQRYFGKSAAEVTPAEAAMLAGLLKAPTRYSPTASLERSQDRAAVVLQLMFEQDYISEAQLADATAQPAQLSAAAEARAGGYFADWVMGAAPSFLTRDTTEDVIMRTTFDPRIQTAAEEAMTKIFTDRLDEDSTIQAAIVVMSADGAVRAMVGGRKFKGIVGQFNRAVQARRQTGSAFKPFVYAAALDLGMSYADVVVDEEYCVDVPGSGEYCPKNYSKKFMGRVTLTDALRHSLNIPAIRVAVDTGLETVRTVASMFGIQSDLAQGPALALGASESTLIEMTGAYAGILNGGTSVTPYGMIDLRLDGDDTALMGQDGGLGERVITQDTARELIYMMNQVVEAGTGKRARIEGTEIAGKTGTTQAGRDAWFMGFTGDYVTGVWMGNDDNSPMKRVTGGSYPAEIWRETMSRVQDGTPGTPLPMIRPASRPVVPPEVALAPVRATGDTAERALLGVLQRIFGTGQ
ncbi:transglycosylase domain-containing protein [Candidatus Halocynthiibacter alkanivorans]|jgi:1A family penicillin-binding protein|uniref:transglycosylase domain-containing protein n=1 Tax=Candidatus Halocynthiibacter alkanivorans TaxID=2267619 RepID=UPI000DF3816A|nr:transglycosylase domain-containing protein [Candidatus Halocynthiibacter alkanivorans]